MTNPTTHRPSTQLLRELIEVRIQLADVENSNEPTIARIDPLNCLLYTSPSPRDDT